MVDQPVPPTSPPINSVLDGPAVDKDYLVNAISEDGAWQQKIRKIFHNIVLHNQTLSKIGI